jgi:hypothetical protein
MRRAAETRDMDTKMLKDHFIKAQVALFSRLSIRCWIAKYLIIIFCLDLSVPLKAQERVRTSAGRLPIESFLNPEAFFRIGPLQEAVTGTAGVQYTDNADLTNTNKVSRFRIFQGLNLDTVWLLSHYNKLELIFGGQLNEDFLGNGKNQLNGSISASGIQFQFAISNFQVRLFEDFSYVQNPTTNPAATNTTNLNSLTNTIGAAIDADLGIAILSLSGDYTYNNQSGSNAQGQTNSSTTGTRNSFRVGPALTFQWSQNIQYGINASLSRTNGSGGENGSGTSNVSSLSVGPFIKGKLSRFTDFNLAGGALLVNATPSVPTSYYFNGVLRHQLNRNWQIILSGSHDLVFTTGTNLTEENTVAIGTQMNLTRFITFTVSPLINFGDVKNGVNSGNFTQYGIEAGLGWKPHRRWSTGLIYYFIRRNGTSASDSYIQNTVTLQVNYRF